MSKNNMTEEQKLYFFYGYIYCKAQEFAQEFPHYTIEQAMDMFINDLKPLKK